MLNKEQPITMKGILMKAYLLTVLVFFLIHNSSFSNSMVPLNIAADDSNITLEGRLPVGYCHDAVPFGDHYAIVGSGRGVRIMDISLQSHPRSIAEVETGGSVTDIFVSGNYAYVTTNGQDGLSLTDEFTGGLTIIDLSNPVQPQTVSFYDLQSFCETITGFGNYVYIAASSSVIVFDVSDASNPQKTGSVYVGNAPHGVFTDGHYLYVAAQSAGFKIYDLSDPAHPSAKGSYQYWSEKIFVRDTIAIVTSQQSGMAIFSVNDPANPLKLSEISSEDYSDGYFDAALKGSFLYGIGRGSGKGPMVKVFDISDPNAPTFVSVAYFDSISSTYGERISVYSNHAMIAAQNGFHILDLGMDGTVQPIGTYYTQLNLKDLKIVNNLAYSTFEVPNTSFKVGGISIVDISTPSNLKEIGYLYLTPKGNESSVSIAGNYAYVTRESVFPDSLQGIHIINISDPHNPVQDAFFHLKNITNNIATDGSYLYVEKNFAGDTLLFFDITQPKNPQFIGQYGINTFTEGSIGEIVLDTDRLYLGTRKGIMIFNRNASGGVDYLGFHSLKDEYYLDVHGMRVNENYAYLATTDGFFVVDISNPSKPFTKAKISEYNHHYFMDVDLIGDDIYLAQPMVIELYNLNGDTLIQNGTYHINSYSVRKLAKYGPYLCATCEGLMIFKKGSATGIRDKKSAFVDNFALFQNYPNPFNPTTNIRFSITKQTHVTLKVFDILGREIVTLVDEKLSAGEHRVTFDGENLPSGVYFYQLQVGNWIQQRKMVLLK